MNDNLYLYNLHSRIDGRKALNDDHAGDVPVIFEGGVGPGLAGETGIAVHWVNDVLHVSRKANQ